MATNHSSTVSHPQSPSPRPDRSKLDWNMPKRATRTSRKEWGVVRRLMLPVCADPNGGSAAPESASSPEVTQ